MQFLLVLVTGGAAFAGYKEWPFYTILVAAAALVVWHLLRFGTQIMQVAAGGPLAYLLRISIINFIQSLVFYGAGRLLHHVIG